MYNQDFLEKVNSFSLIDLVSEYVEIEKQGSLYACCCPFKDHSDTNASFRIYPETNSFYCFGCEKGGNAIVFLKEMGFDFNGAVEFLSNKLNIPLPVNKYEKIFKYYQTKQILYSSNLIGNAENSFAYLRSRGISKQSIVTWGLGNNKKNRITFPLFNRNRQILGISLRYINMPSDANDKYWHPKNSCNYEKTHWLYGDYYNKSSYLYGIHLYDSKHDSPFIYFTEGAIDVILAQQYGMKNSFALLGKNFSDEHLNTVKHLKKLPVFVLDNDEAGIKGMHNACEKCLAAGIVPYVVILENNSDLADMANKYKHGLQQYISENMYNYSFYLIKRALDIYQKNFYDFQRPYYELFKENLNKIDSKEKDYALTIIKQMTGMVLGGIDEVFKMQS